MQILSDQALLLLMHNNNLDMDYKAQMVGCNSDSITMLQSYTTLPGSYP